MIFCVQGQVTQTGGGTFLIQQGVDSDGHDLIATTRASPQTVSSVYKKKTKKNAVI